MATKIDWNAVVEEAKKGKPEKPDIAYEFSNGRKFERPSDPYKQD